MKTHLVRHLLSLSILTLWIGACSSKPKIVAAPVTTDTSVAALPPGAGPNLFAPGPTYDGSTTINPLTTDPNQAACLTNGYYGGSQTMQGGYSSIPNYSSTGTTLPACVDSQIASQQSLLDTGLQTYGYLSACLQLVLSQPPQNDQVAGQAHIMGRLALIRCYQQIVQNMQQVQPWGGQQQSLFGQQSNALASLIIILSDDKKHHHKK